MFCEAAQNMPGLDEQIQEAMDFFEGVTVSRNSYLTSSEKAVDEGELIYFDASPDIAKIITDAGKEYEIWFYTYIIYKEYTERVGISEITIRNSSGYDYVIGDFYLVNPEYK